MSILQIAVVGAGLIGKAHIQLIQQHPQMRLLAIVDPAPATQALATKAQVPLYASLQDLLSTHQPDGIVLASPNALHLPQALACLQAGVPLLLEKPIATSVAQGRELVKAVQHHQAKVLVGHHRAHSPIMAAASEVLASGRLGELVSVMGSATFFKPEQYFLDGPWRTQPGGGPIQINMIHEVHNLRMLCGEIVEVQALASHAARGFAVEDTVAINLRFANGALGSFMLSDSAASARSWEQTSQENKSYASYADEDCYVIAGTMGSLAVPTMRLKYYRNQQERSWMKPFEQSVIALQRQDPLQLQMAHFARVIRGEELPLVNIMDGLRNLCVTEAITRAAASGQVIRLEGEFDALA